MPRKEATRMIRVGENLAAAAEKHAKDLGWSFNQFGEEAIRVLCEMIENPKSRRVPKVVNFLDTLRYESAELEKDPIIHLHAAEDPAQMQPPIPRKT